MSHFDITNTRDREVRHCRTRAFVARLFAAHPVHQSNSGLWEEVACAWDDLADFKQRGVLMNDWTAKLGSDVKDDLILVDEWEAIWERIGGEKC